MSCRLTSRMNGEKAKLIAALAKKAQEDWQARHLCLPSLVVALALHDIRRNAACDFMQPFDLSFGLSALFPLRKDGYRGGYSSVEEAVRSHNTYLAEWKAGEQAHPNWEGLAGQKYYILAVQYLQDAQYPYYPEKKAETELVELIEQNGLNRYDKMTCYGF